MKTAQAADLSAFVPDGCTLMIRGFMVVGTPPSLIDELVREGRRNLTVIANDTARHGVGIGNLIEASLVHRVVTSHIGKKPEMHRPLRLGQLEVELMPQCTLLEWVRAGGFGLSVDFRTRLTHLSIER